MKRIVLNVFALVVVLGFAALGNWQLGREASKRTQLAQAQAALAAAPVALGAASRAGSDGIARVDGGGRFLDTPALWLDNQRRGTRVGVRLYCGFAPDGGVPLLVDLGWLPLPGTRELPDETCPRGPQRVAGLLLPPPATGLRIGPGLVAQRAIAAPDAGGAQHPGSAQDSGAAWLATRVEPAAVAAAWRLPEPFGARVLRLDPALPLGFERDLALHPNTLPPERHRGYALQWFGLAVAAVVVTLVLNLRRRP